MKPTVQLLAYRFGPDASFEGALVGALERIESGGTLRIRDALFVGRDPESGELIAVGVRAEHQGSLVAPLLGFRLDPAERRRCTEHALSAYDRGETGNVLEQVGETLSPGDSVAVVLVEHVWARALGDAVERTGGSPLLNGYVDGVELTELSSWLAAALAPRPG